MYFKTVLNSMNLFKLRINELIEPLKLLEPFELTEWNGFNVMNLLCKRFHN